MKTLLNDPQTFPNSGDFDNIPGEYLSKTRLFNELQKNKPRYDRMLSAADSKAANEENMRKRSEDAKAKPGAKAKNKKAKPKHKTGDTEREQAAKILGKRVLQPVFQWSMIARGVAGVESDLSKWGGWYKDDTIGQGFAYVSSNLVDAFNESVTGETHSFRRKKWKMVWNSNSKTGLSTIDPHFQVEWGDEENTVQFTSLTQRQNWEINVVNRLVADAAIAIFKKVQSRTLESLSVLARTSEPEHVLLLPTDTAIPAHKTTVTCKEGTIVEEKQKTGGVNALRISDEIRIGMDANIPRMLGTGDYLLEELPVWVLPEQNSGTGETARLGLSHKNRQLMGWLRGVGHIWEERAIAAEELMVGKTGPEDTFAAVLVGRSIIDQLVVMNNEAVDNMNHSARRAIESRDFVMNSQGEHETSI